MIRYRFTVIICENDIAALTIDFSSISILSAFTNIFLNHRVFAVRSRILFRETGNFNNTVVKICHFAADIAVSRTAKAQITGKNVITWYIKNGRSAAITSHAVDSSHKTAGKSRCCIRFNAAIKNRNVIEDQIVVICSVRRSGSCRSIAPDAYNTAAVDLTGYLVAFNLAVFNRNFWHILLCRADKSSSRTEFHISRIINFGIGLILIIEFCTCTWYFCIV